MINREVRTSFGKQAWVSRWTRQHLQYITITPATLLLYYIVTPPVALQPDSYPSYYNSQASTHRADYNIVDQEAFDNNATTISNNSSWEVNTAADLAKLRNDGKLLTSQELKELNTRIKTFEEIARMEDRLRALESRKRLRSQESSELTLPPKDSTAPTRLPKAPLLSRGSSSYY